MKTSKIILVSISLLVMVMGVYVGGPFGFLISTAGAVGVGYWSIIFWDSHISFIMILHILALCCGYILWTRWHSEWTLIIYVGVLAGTGLSIWMSLRREAAKFKRAGTVDRRGS